MVLPYYSTIVFGKINNLLNFDCCFLSFSYGYFLFLFFFCSALILTVEILTILLSKVIQIANVRTLLWQRFSHMYCPNGY
jgi:hypothetical protein